MWAAEAIVRMLMYNFSFDILIHTITYSMNENLICASLRLQGLSVIMGAIFALVAVTRHLCY